METIFPKIIETKDVMNKKEELKKQRKKDILTQNMFNKR